MHAAPVDGRKNRILRWVFVLGLGVIVLGCGYLLLVDSSASVMRASIARGMSLTSYALGSDSAVVCISVRSNLSDPSLAADLPENVLPSAGSSRAVAVPISQCRLTVRVAADTNPPTRLRERNTGLPAAVLWIERQSPTRVRLGIEGGEYVGAIYQCRAIPAIMTWIVAACSPTTIS